MFGWLSTVSSGFLLATAPAGDKLSNSWAAETLPPRLELGRERLTVAVCRRDAGQVVFIGAENSCSCCGRRVCRAPTHTV